MADSFEAVEKRPIHTKAAVPVVSRKTAGSMRSVRCEGKGKKRWEGKGKKRWEGKGKKRWEGKGKKPWEGGQGHEHGRRCNLDVLADDCG